MLLSGGNPEKQDCDWAQFIMAATSRFTQDMANAIHIMVNHLSLLPVSQLFSRVHDPFKLLQEDPDSKTTSSVFVALFFV